MTEAPSFNPLIIASRLGFDLEYHRELGYCVEDWLCGVFQVDMVIARKTLNNLIQRRVISKVMGRYWRNATVAKPRRTTFFTNDHGLLLFFIKYPPRSKHYHLRQEVLEIFQQECPEDLNNVKHFIPQIRKAEEPQ